MSKRTMMDQFMEINMNIPNHSVLEWVISMNCRGCRNSSTSPRASIDIEIKMQKTQSGRFPWHARGKSKDNAKVWI